MQTGTSRRSFIAGSCAVAAQVAMGEVGKASGGLRVKFLGTGAADWLGPRKEPKELRRWTSVLIDRRVLIDFTNNSLDLLGEDRPEDCFYTHSHDDHYDPPAALKAGVKRVYVHESWREDAAREFAAAAKKAECEPSEVRPVRIGETYEEAGVRFMPLPANHLTDRRHEQSCIYLVVKGGKRMLYATDTSGIPQKALDLAGYLDLIVMEATIGQRQEEDYRIFEHSTVEQVLHSVRALAKTGAYRGPADRPVYLTHLARTLHPCQAELDRTLPAPLRAAYDGLEVVL